jgi:hypothetical protein
VGKQLTDRRAETRTALRQGADKGAHAEQALRLILARYLPKKFSVGQGEVIDTEGRRSAQTDIIVANEYQPIIYPETEPGIFFIEGVDAAGEVKSILTGDELDRAVANSKRFKTLKALDPIGMRMAIPADLPRYHTRRPWFLFAYESQLNLETTAQRIQESAAKLGTEGDFQLDALFVLNRGVLINLGDGEESFAIVRPDGGRHAGWVLHETQDVMFALMVWLLTVMPRAQRMTPLLPEYTISIVH